MKKFILLSCAVLFSFFLFSQNVLNKSVGVMRPNNSKNAEAFFKNYASVLNRQGYREAAQYVASLGGKSFGSCFVVMGPDGRYYAITNRHAVEFADSAKVQFINGRDTVSYDGLEIAKVSEDLDLAAVLLPSGVEFTPLDIFSGSISDGAEVFTAGFPGISGKPSWQFGKGIVSNAQFYNDLLTNDSARSVIQHTAQIDAGSSGGPLLVRDDSVYKVAGVNTWKVSNRDGMNLAINNNDLRKFIASLGNSRRESPEELAGIYSQVAAEVQNGYKNILPRLSYTYMFYMSFSEIDKSFSNTPKAVREDIDNLMKIGHFTESLRLLSAYNAAKKMAEQPFEYQSLTSTGNEVILSGANNMEMVFIWEKDSWRISKIGKNASRRKVAQNAADSYGPGINGDVSGAILQLRFTYPVTHKGSPDYGMGGQLTVGGIKNFMSYESAWVYRKYHDYNYFGIGFRYGGNLPVQLSPHVLIMPSIKLHIGMDLTFDGFSSCGIIGGLAGLDFLFRLGHSYSYLMLGVTYEHYGYFPFHHEYKIDNAGYIGTHLGFII